MPDEVDSASGEIITFYSYKGGTGRTMALANVGCLLALRPEARRGVLLVDWDLEAPGLHRYFADRLQRALGERAEQELQRRPGLIDLFERLRARVEALPKYEEEPPPEVLEELAREVPLDEFQMQTDIPGVWLLKAGRFDEDYAKRVNTFPWDPLYHRAGWLFPWFADWLTSRFSYVLIDSRTGITDTSGICTMILPDKLVVVFTPNAQSLEGVLEMTQRATNYRRSSVVRPLGVFPLPSRIEASEPQQLQKWRKSERGYQPQFENLFRKVWKLPSCNLEKYFDEVQVQHVSTYAYGEKVATLLELDDNRLGLKRSFASFAEKLATMGDSWEAPETAEALSHDSEIAREAGAVYASLPPDEQEAARLLFLSFVRLVQGEPRTVAAVRTRGLPARLMRAAEPFVQKRIVLESEGRLSVASEKLAQDWDLLHDLTVAERPFLEWRDVLRSLMADWERNGQAKSELLNGKKLDEAEGYLVRRREVLDSAEIAYIQASQAERASQAKARRLLIWKMAAGGLVVLSVLVGSIWRDETNRRLLEQNRLRAAAINAQAVDLLTRPTEMAAGILLAIESERLSPSPDAELTLRKWVSLLPKRVGVYKHKEPVTHVAISPASMAASATANEVVMHIVGGASRVSAANQEAVGIAFTSKNALSILVRKSILMDYGAGAQPAFTGLSPISKWAMSADGRFLATGNAYGSVTIWSMEDYRISRQQTGLGAISAIALSSDGRYVAVGTADGRLTVLDPAGNESAFQDEKAMAARAADGKLTVLDPAGKKSMFQHEKAIRAIAFSPDSKYLASSTPTNVRDTDAIYIWPLGGGPPVENIHVSVSGEASHLAFSPDGRLLASGGMYTEHLFKLPECQTVYTNNMEMAAESVEFGSDGSYVTVGSAGGLAEFRSTSAPYFVTQLFPTGAPVTALALDKRDKYVITGSADGSVIIWQPMLDNLRSKSGRELMDIACSRLWTNLGQDKWKQYFATEPYRKTCPALN